MKTNLLFATAILLSAATFGQQTETKTTQPESAQAATIKSGSDASIQAYASTKVTSRADGSAEHQITLAKKQAKNTSSSIEKKVSAQAKSAVNKGQEATEANPGAKASVQANSGLNASSGNNKVKQDASLNAGLNASSADAKSHAESLSKEEQAPVKTEAKETLKTTNSVKKEADKGIAETAGSVKSTAGGIKQAVKPRPVSVKVHSQIKANAGIKIK